MIIMHKIKSFRYIVPLGICLAVASCTPTLAPLAETKAVPESFGKSTDTINTSNTPWRTYFKDPNLVSLIDTALKNNQELQITLQEIEIAKNDIRVKKGLLLPSVGIGAGAGIEKVGRYTSQGAGDASTEIKPGTEMPDPLGDFKLGAYAHWEVDIWKKLRNSKKAAVSRYLATVEGKNFVVTNLIAEIANSYYELLALDNQLAIVKQNIEIQTNALQIVKMEKEATRVTELAVRRFQAQVFHTVELQFSIQQKITEA